MQKRELPHRVNQDRVLASFNMTFLRTAGYTTKEIHDLRDLSKLTSEEMQKLLHKKTLEAVTQATKGTEIKPFSRRVHRDSSST